MAVDYFAAAQGGFEELQAGKLEHDAVQYMAKVCKLPKEFKKRLYDTAASRASRLNVSIWQQSFQFFPFLFFVQNEGQLKEYGKIKTFLDGGARKRERKKLKVLIESLQEEAEQRVIGLLTKVPYYQGWCILHNGAVPELGDAEFYMCLSLEESKPYRSFAVFESLEQFVSRHAGSLQEYYSEPLWTG